MRVVMDFTGAHEPPLPRMEVDRHGFLIDLSKVVGTLHDRTIGRVEWGPVVVRGEHREAGMIYYRDGGRKPFWDVLALAPYLQAFAARKAELEA